MTEAVAGIAGKLPDCPERSAFINLCRQAQAIANQAAGRSAAASTSGIVRLGLAGPFHQATAKRPSLEVRLDPPPGVYKRIVFRFQLHHGGWNQVPSKNHNLFWFARDKHRDLFGFAIAKGPGGPPQVFYRTDWGVKHTNKQRVTRKSLLRAGETYDVRFDFDAAGGRIVLTLNDASGAEILRAVGKPNIGRIPFDPGQKIAVGFGFRGEYDNEPAQPGWTWSDLHIELETATD